MRLHLPWVFLSPTLVRTPFRIWSPSESWRLSPTLVGTPKIDGAPAKAGDRMEPRESWRLRSSRESWRQNGVPAKAGDWEVMWYNQNKSLTFPLWQIRCKRASGLWFVSDSRQDSIRDFVIIVESPFRARQGQVSDFRLHGVRPLGRDKAKSLPEGRTSNPKPR
jgi:hypothetical protein